MLYANTITELRNQYNKVKFINLSVGGLGVLGKNKNKGIENNREE